MRIIALHISLFFALLLGNPLFGDDQNSTLINADKTTYTNLLKTINDSKISNDETALQKILLEKLINVTPSVTITPPKTPENMDDYSRLFSRYMDNVVKKDMLTTKIHSISTKIKTLEKELKNLDNDPLAQRTLQLQSALYLKSVQEYKEQNDVISKEMPLIEKMLIDTLNTFTFEPQSLAAKTLSNQEEAFKLRSSMENILVKKERFELLGDKRDRGVSPNLIASTKENYNKALQASVASLFLEFSNALKLKDNKAFALEKKMLDEISNMETPHAIKDDIASLLHSMEKSYLGTIDTITGSTTQEFKNILKASWMMISEPVFTVNGTPVNIFKLILAALIFVIGIFIGGFYKTSIKKIASNSKSINLATRTMLANIGYYLIVITAFFIALNILGIDLSSIALVAGALSVGIGFGLQNVVSNFVSGIILMFERSIKIGDFVELSDTLRGHVSDIRMRSTTLNTNGNIDVIVPNRNFIESNVINWTMHDKLKRFDIPFGVAYGTKPEQVIDIIVKAVDQCNYKDVIKTPERSTSVVMTGMGNSSVNFALQVWIHGEEILAPTKTMSRFYVLIYNTLNENGIEIPFPQQDLHIKSIDTHANEKLEIQAKKEEL
ncbi:mechanosensitive ion channel family protein [Sulfurospirillum sp.]|uniref:mechanosensitive ion channel family protein n=1 Tax=Sulfurospirillum sp. TaxID=2053622 RepID=UPI002FDD3AF9